MNFLKCWMSVNVPEILINILIMTSFVSCRVPLVTYGRGKSPVAGLFTIHIRRGSLLNLF